MTDYRMQFAKRTIEHIHKVHNNMLYLVTNFGEDIYKMYNLSERELLHQVLHHDISKFNDVQYFAYADYFNSGATGEEKERYKVDFEIAWENHKHNENHHFEGQRYMRPNQIIEMVCDWQAMSQEFEEGSCRKYYEEKWRPQYFEYFENYKGSLTFKGNWVDDFEYAKFEQIVLQCIAWFETENEANL